jgi:hypothetical protein
VIHTTTNANRSPARQQMLPATTILFEVNHILEQVTCPRSYYNFPSWLNLLCSKRKLVHSLVTVTSIPHNCSSSHLLEDSVPNCHSKYWSHSVTDYKP